MKRVAILGKGAIALHACEIASQIDGWSVSKVVVNEIEPDWDIRFSDHVADRWPDIELCRSGDWRELLWGEFDLVLSMQYDRVIGGSLLLESGRVLNCHLGRLPSYRGMRPVNWALKNRESVHGVTIHEVIERVDSGPIVSQVLFPIWPAVDEVRDVWIRSRKYAALLISDTLPKIDSIAAQPQDESFAKTYYLSDDRFLGDRLGWVRPYTQNSGPGSC
ncbi:formyltransferase family protein [Nocardia suismassiliense]|uniref:formyltransferase family protein n=1 Tax=Nocardia suismassiliense TaxID=2077092 RepID=UPI0018FE617A|nr:formyltransferase family protein [Nocardia suismassiliense]